MINQASTTVALLLATATVTLSSNVSRALGASHTAHAASGGPSTISDSTIELLGYHTTVPTTWTWRKPSSTSRLAQYTVHAAGPADDAEVVAFFFGSSQRPSVDANLTRWREQFSTPDGSPVPETILRDSTSAFPLTVAEFRGTYKRGVGAGSADSVRAGQTLVATIVETPKGTLFIQLFGPSSTVAARRAEFLRVVKDLK